jgi:AraC family transcriptional regulator
MEVQIINFPETKVAVIEHHGSPRLEYDTVRKLVSWKIANRLTDPSKHRSYGIHHTNPFATPEANHHVDFCLSIDFDVPANELGIKSCVIPRLRCALARDIGSRTNNKAIGYLIQEWLPTSGEALADHPAIFHYVNVGPDVKPEDMITDVYLPLA